MRAAMMFLALSALTTPVTVTAQQAPQQESSIWDILNLPQTVEEGRRAGVSSGSIWAVLDSLRRRGVPGEEAGQIVRAEVDAVKGGAPKENFGSYVNAQLARGLRGRELAAAIHAEHARRGMGRGKSEDAGAAGRDRDRDRDRDRAQNQDQDRDRDRDRDRGRDSAVGKDKERERKP